MKLPKALARPVFLSDGETARVRRSLDERALQLWEGRLHKRRDRIQHRRQRAQDCSLYARRVRCSLHDVWLQCGFFGACVEVTDRVRCILSCSLLPVVRPAMTMGTMGAIPFGRLKQAHGALERLSNQLSVGA